MKKPWVAGLRCLLLDVASLRELTATAMAFAEAEDLSLETASAQEWRKVAGASSDGAAGFGRRWA